MIPSCTRRQPLLAGKSSTGSQAPKSQNVSEPSVLSLYSQRIRYERCRLLQSNRLPNGSCMETSWLHMSGLAQRLPRWRIKLQRGSDIGGRIERLLVFRKTQHSYIVATDGFCLQNLGNHHTRGTYPAMSVKMITWAAGHDSYIV